MKYSRLAVLAVLAVSISLVGCASSGEGAGQRPSRQANLLTEEELRAVPQTNLYDIVASHRPAWLRQSAQISFENPDAGQTLVYLDFVEAGGVRYLRQLNVRDVMSVQYLTPTEAAQRFGLRTNSGPVILVNTFSATR